MFRPAPGKTVPDGSASYTNIFELNASDSSIPETATEDEKPVLEKLLSLIKLVALKYDIKYVLGRFDKKSPDNISVILSNASRVKRQDCFEQESLQAILYLKSFGTCSMENKTGYPHLTSTVITINKDNIDDAMKGLDLLATPTQEEVEDRHQSKMTMAC